MGRLPILVVLMTATVYASVPVEYHYHGQPGKHHPLRSLKKGNLKCICLRIKTFIYVYQIQPTIQQNTLLG